MPSSRFLSLRSRSVVANCPGRRQLSSSHRLASNAPSQSATNPGSNSSSSSNINTILATLVVGGGAFYYFTRTDQGVKLEKKGEAYVHRVEEKLVNAATGTGTRSPPPDARASIESKSSLGQRAGEELHRDGQYVSDKARAAASDARRGYENVKGDVNSSMASARERAEDLEYDTRRRAEEVKQDVRSTGKGWLDFGSAKVDEAESLLEKQKRALADRTNAALSSAKSEYRHDVDSAKSAVDAAASRIQSKADEAKRVVEEGVEGVKETGKGWLGWGASKKDAVVDRAAEMKEGAKDGLLAAEKKVERGAQKAQEQTKKM